MGYKRGRVDNRTRIDANTDLITLKALAKPFADQVKCDWSADVFILWDKVLALMMRDCRYKIQWVTNTQIAYIWSLCRARFEKIKEIQFDKFPAWVSWIIMRLTNVSLLTSELNNQWYLHKLNISYIEDYLKTKKRGLNWSRINLGFKQKLIAEMLLISLYLYDNKVIEWISLKKIADELNKGYRISANLIISLLLRYHGFNDWEIRGILVKDELITNKENFAKFISKEKGFIKKDLFDFLFKMSVPREDVRRIRKDKDQWWRWRWREPFAWEIAYSVGHVDWAVDDWLYTVWWPVDSILCNVLSEALGKKFDEDKKG